MILRDADILEQLGAIGIVRVAAKIGRDTRYATFTDAATTLRKALAELPGQLHLDTAKTLAGPGSFFWKPSLRSWSRKHTAHSTEVFRYGYLLCFKVESPRLECERLPLPRR